MSNFDHLRLTTEEFAQAVKDNPRTPFRELIIAVQFTKVLYVFRYE
jgi:hypothetical protein